MQREGRSVLGFAVAVCRLCPFRPFGLFGPFEVPKEHKGQKGRKTLRLPGRTDPYPYRGRHRGKALTEKSGWNPDTAIRPAVLLYAA